MANKFPHMKKPCAECPYRKDSQKGWLGEAGMKGFLKAGSFICHKETSLQCAGHMLIKGEGNDFVQVANRLGIQLDLSGAELVFDSEEDCINHHKG